MEIISRKEAKAKGLKTYFNGKPCPHGHIAPRDVQSCVCLDCKILYEKTQKFKDTLKNSDLKRKYGITLKQYNKLLEEQDDSQDVSIKNSDSEDDESWYE